ncbi:MAG: hypothetical protein AAFY65_06525 [Pseudomonadota bacterium]
MSKQFKMRGRLVFGFLICATMPAPLLAEDSLETIMWKIVVETNDLDTVDSFIEKFPLSANIGAAREMAKDLREQREALALEDDIFDLLGDVAYDRPLAFGSERIMGKTLAEITDSAPAYPPIEGLPAEVWKDKSCGSCHEWTRENLCRQAGTYISQDPERYQNKPHPFGGMLKINLRNWAQNDCN